MPYFLIFIIIAAIFNALMDKVETTIQFNTSIFSKKNKLFWSKVDSANNNGFFIGTKYRVDAWHLSKSFALILLFIAMVTYRPFFYTIDLMQLITPSTIVNFIICAILDIVITGIIWNYIFDLFYHKIFYRPNTLIDN